MRTHSHGTERLVFHIKKILKPLLSFLSALGISCLILFFSISFPYIIAKLHNHSWVMWITKTDISLIKIELPNYIQSVSSILSFLTASTLSILVYRMNIEKNVKERRQAAYNIWMCFQTSIDSIDSFLMKTDGILRLGSINKPISDKLLTLNLKKSDVDLINKYYFDLQRIDYALQHNFDNVKELCIKITKEKDYLIFKTLLDKIYKSYI